MSLILVMGIILQMPSNVDWSYRFLEQNNYKIMRALFETNDLDFQEVHKASWWPSGNRKKVYKNIRLRLSDVFLLNGNHAVIYLQEKVHTIPGTSIIKLLLFSKEGQFLDAVIIDMNGRIAFFNLTSEGSFVSMTMANIGAPPSKGNYWIFLNHGGSRRELGLAVNHERGTAETRFIVRDNRLVLVVNGF